MSQSEVLGVLKYTSFAVLVNLSQANHHLDNEILWQYNFGKLKDVIVATKPLESPYANEFKI